MLTPISVSGTSLGGVQFAEDMESLFSGGVTTIATLPNSVGRLDGVNPDTISFGVKGDEALLTLLLRVSPIA